MKRQFDYATFTACSIGFLTADEPARLYQSCVVCGVGGMGRAAFMDSLRGCVVRPGPRRESPNDPIFGKRRDAITEKDKRAAVLRESTS